MELLEPHALNFLLKSLHFLPLLVKIYLDKLPYVLNYAKSTQKFLDEPVFFAFSHKK